MQNYFIFLTSMLLANYLYVGDYLEKICEPSQTSYILVIYYNQNRTHQSWELGRKCDSNFFDFCHHKGQIRQHYNRKNVCQKFVISGSVSMMQQCIINNIYIKNNH